MLDIVLSIPVVVRTKFDFCMLGMIGEDELGVAPAEKSKGIMTNGKVIAEVISQHCCDGSWASQARPPRPRQGQTMRILP